MKKLLKKSIVPMIGFIAFFFFSTTDLEAAQIYHPDGTPSATPIIDQPYGYTGRREDAESGLHYFRARYYSSDQGRFISRDPIGYGDGRGLYGGYFGERFGVDPLGLEHTPVTLPIDVAQIIQSGKEQGIPLEDILAAIKELSDPDVAAEVDVKGVNCLGYACGVGMATQPRENKTLSEVVDYLGYNCKKGITAYDCQDHCKCSDCIMIYIYVKKSVKDMKKVKKKYKSKDPLKDIKWNKKVRKELDFHALKCSSKNKRGYTYQESHATKGSAKDKAKSVVYTKAKKDYFGAHQTIAKYCCCKDKED